MKNYTSKTRIGKTVKRGGVVRRFDWRPSSHTEENAKRRLQGLDCYSTGKRRKKIKRKQPLNLNQYKEGACSGFGAAHALASGPVPNVNMTEDEARQIYYQARREDEWEGEAYDGSSVNGAMHACRTRGHITEWRWAKTPEEVLHGLSYHGSAEAGSAWLEGMWNIDENGYIHATGNESGGHAYCVSGFRPCETCASGVDYWIDNSWGPEWGINGGAWLHGDDAHKLWFESWGEIAFPLKRSTQAKADPWPTA